MMNYAIQELTNWSRNFATCETLKDCSKKYKEAAEALSKKEHFEASEDILKDLNGSLNRVLEGLKNWGADHLEAKQRQLKKAEDLKEALKFLNSKPIINLKQDEK